MSGVLNLRQGFRWAFVLHLCYGLGLRALRRTGLGCFGFRGLGFKGLGLRASGLGGLPCNTPLCHSAASLPKAFLLEPNFVLNPLHI